MSDTPFVEGEGRETVMGCPKCSNALYEFSDGITSHFRCQNGHGYTMDEMCPGLESILGDLWNKAINTLTKE